MTPKARGLGIATTFGQERNMPTWIACVARVAADRRSGVVRVERLTIVRRCRHHRRSGRRAGADRGQGAVGLSMALYEGSEFVKGQVKDLDTYGPLRIDDAPEIDVEFVDSTEVPVVLGEPGTPSSRLSGYVCATCLSVRPAMVMQSLTRQS
jgi:isoquinoline 1-oxidoreductase subunit beta